MSSSQTSNIYTNYIQSIQNLNFTFRDPATNLGDQVNNLFPPVIAELQLTPTPNASDFNGLTFTSPMNAVINDMSTGSQAPTLFGAPLPPYGITPTGARENITNFTKFIVDVTSNITSGLTTVTTDPNSIFNLLYSDFETAEGISQTPGDLGDLQDLMPVIQAQFGPNPTTAQIEQFKQTYFTNAFNAFLSNYTFRQVIFPDQGIPLTNPTTQSSFTTAGNDFFNDWHSFLTARTSIDTSGGGFANLTTYQQLFSAFIPQATTQDFQTALQQFYNSQVSQNGYFLPSQSLGAWITQVEADAATVNQTSSTVVSPSDAQKLVVVNKLIFLLIQMIDLIQRTSATQADRLTFYANVQQAYTDLINRVPIFNTGQLSSVVSDSGQSIANLGQTLQADTQSWSSNLQAFRDQFGTEGKAHETAVQQSGQTVNNQADLITAILQEMNTIVQTVFK